jgi:hypothetical protein
MESELSYEIGKPISLLAGVDVGRFVMKFYGIAVCYVKHKINPQGVCAILLRSSSAAGELEYSIKESG